MTHEPQTARYTSRPVTLGDLDLTAKLKRSVYEARLLQLQTDLVHLQRKVVEHKLRPVFVFEGMDAAGKGGVIKRLTQFLDPRGVEVHPIGAPNMMESGHHHLRRFWQRLPSRGRIALFDRSWYGRMLVEPIEGFCTPQEYDRAPREIRDFERMLTDDGYIILKYWIHIDKDEQLKRFKGREEDELKQWKLTPDDWRNREKFDLYVKYANAMFTATNTPFAPWFLISGNSKPWARITVLQTVVDYLQAWPNQPE
jgi:AMP-polyphosphate phosphotransferase